VEQLSPATPITTAPGATNDVRLASLTIRSEVGRYLWPLYLFGLAWILLPVYAAELSTVITIPAPDIDRLVQVTGVAVGLMAWWSGSRGGPLLLSEPVVLFELAAGGGARRVRFAVVRQALLMGALFGLVASLASSVTGGVEDIDLDVSSQRTLVALALGISTVSLAVLWTTEPPDTRDAPDATTATTTRNRTLTGRARAASAAADRVAAVAGGVAMATAAVLIEPGWGLGLATFAIATMALMVASVRARNVPLTVLWPRASAMTDLQASTAFLDAPGAMKALRAVRDGSRVGRISGFGLRFTPVALWRTQRSLAASTWPVFFRLTAVPVVVALTLVAFDGVGTRVAVAAVALFVGAVDITGSLGAVVAQPLLSRGYRFRSGVLLGSLALTSLIITVALAAAGWLLASAVNASDELSAQLSGGVSGKLSIGFDSILGVAVGVGVAANLQARLGSADMERLIERVGAGQLSQILAARAAMPILVVLVTVVAVARLDPFLTSGIELTILAYTLLAAVAATVRPLERSS